MVERGGVREGQKSDEEEREGREGGQGTPMKVDKDLIHKISKYCRKFIYRSDGVDPPYSS